MEKIFDHLLLFFHIKLADSNRWLLDFRLIIWERDVDGFFELFEQRLVLVVFCAVFDHGPHAVDHFLVLVHNLSVV
jgi:hypothetical protein